MLPSSVAPCRPPFLVAPAGVSQPGGAEQGSGGAEVRRNWRPGRSRTPRDGLRPANGDQTRLTSTHCSPCSTFSRAMSPESHLRLAPNQELAGQRVVPWLG